MKAKMEIKDRHREFKVPGGTLKRGTKAACFEFPNRVTEKNHNHAVVIFLN